MSLYAEYLKERTNDIIIENDFGFVVYRRLNETTVFIVDIFVKIDSRKEYNGTKLVDLVVEVSQPEVLMATIVPAAKGSTNSLKAALAYGFLLDSSCNDFIILKKNIKG